MTWLLIFLGGGLGSLLRVGISKLAKHAISSQFPWGTLLVNILACTILALFMLGMRKKISQNELSIAFWVLGFCGGFSTFSTFSFENFELLQSGNYLYFILNILISILLGIGIIWLILKSTVY